MNSFEYITVLVSIVIGLAIADIATSLHRLLRAGRRVTWDWLAPLAALLVLLELFNLWWKWHGFTGTTLGEVVPYFAVLLLLFLAASAALPDEIPIEGLDLRVYFSETHRYFWSVYALYVLSWIVLRTQTQLLQGMSFSEVLSDHSFDYPSIVLYVVLIFVRSRLLAAAALITTVAYLSWNWWSSQLATMH